jgi:hypothetical protein
VARSLIRPLRCIPDHAASTRFYALWPVGCRLNDGTRAAGCAVVRWLVARQVFLISPSVPQAQSLILGLPNRAERLPYLTEMIRRMYQDRD